jgi:KDO2-lipid IV(A) lauroyltransferase
MVTNVATTSVLYIFSDILYILIYHIIKYRRKVVNKNLHNSFPEKSERELLKNEREFYHHFCDYFIETLKLINISEKEIKKSELSSLIQIF